MESRLRTFKVGMCVAACALMCALGTGCDSSTTPESTGGNGSEVTAPSTAAPLPTNPALGRSGALVVAVSDVPEGIDPLDVRTDAEKWATDLLFNGLMVLTESGQAVTDLARTVTLSLDKKEVQFELRTNVTFHDGITLKPRDVLYTYERLMTPGYKGTYAQALYALKAVEPVGETGVRLVFSEPISLESTLLHVPIIPMHYYEGKAQLKSVPPVGTGPFQFESAVSDDTLALVARQTDKGKAAGPSAVMMKQMDPEVAMEAFKSGAVDIMSDAGARSLVRELSFAHLVEQPLRLYYTLCFQSADSILSDVEMRRALEAGIDKRRVAEGAFDGALIPRDVPVSSMNELEQYTREFQAFSPYDPKFAGYILDESGWMDTDGDGIRDKDGVPLALEWWVFVEADWSYGVTEIVREQWRALGVDVRVTYMNFSELLERLKNEGHPDVFNMAWELPVNGDPETRFGNPEGKGQYNYVRWYTPESARHLLQIDLARGDRLKAIAYRNWHQLLLEEIPISVLGQGRRMWAVNNRVKHLEMSPYTDWTRRIGGVSIETETP